MAVFEHDRCRLELVEGRRLDLDAQVIELDMIGEGTRDVVARIMCREGSRDLFVSVGPPGLPAELVERMIATARSRQGYRESTWDSRGGDPGAGP